MQTFKIALTIFVALLLQFLLPKYLGFFKYIDLPLIVTVYFGLQRDPILGMLTGVAAGVGGDAVIGGVLGVGGFSKTLIGYLVAMASIKLSLENPLARLAVVAVASAANTLLYTALYQMLEQPLSDASTWGDLGKIIGWRALADTLAAIAIIIMLNRIFAEQTAARRMAIKRRFYE
ncbi:MAG TPA: rod shape-determining protein MreD [Blastocatellia bacterium]|nr:rod shape-determining protein MreD [Blastocatellia bacterium]